MEIKKIIKKYFSSSLYIAVFISYFKEFLRYVKYSSVVKSSKSGMLLGKIIADYHVIEKGLTMPETRMGFGKDRMLQLIKYCEDYINKHNTTNEQLVHAINVINEYQRFHIEKGFTIDELLSDKIENLKDLANNKESCRQKEFTKEEYYKDVYNSFEQFSKSRLSVRNYSEEDVDIECIKEAVELAKHAPSSCNRQTTRVNIFTDKEKIKKILEIQGGNRGFGHLTNKLIILTSDLSYWHGVYEKSGAYVDGGIFAMNLLYSLHFKKIASCPLNCNLSLSKEKKLRQICDIPPSEVFVVMISCGYVPENFKVPYSKRYSTDHIIKIH